jgi:uncharacterized phiE125 gp8 family phage protein
VRYSLERTVGPTAPVISLASMKQHLRVDDDADDPLIAEQMLAATEYVEFFLRRQVMPATWRLKLDRFPSDRWIELPRPPVQSISSIGYVDSAGVSQTFAAPNYALDSGAFPPRIDLAYGVAWPNTLGQPNAVTITYVAGYATSAAVPPSIQAAIKLLVSDLYENREAQTETKLEENKAAMRLLWPHRVLEA